MKYAVLSMAKTLTLSHDHQHLMLIGLSTNMFTFVTHHITPWSWVSTINVLQFTVLLLCYRVSYYTWGFQIISIIFPRVFDFREAPPIIMVNASLNLALSPTILAASTLACQCPLQTCPPLTPRTPPLAPSSPPPPFPPHSAPPPAQHAPASAPAPAPAPASIAWLRSILPCVQARILPCARAASHAPPPDVQCWDPSGCEAPWVAHCSSASVFYDLASYFHL